MSKKLYETKFCLGETSKVIGDYYAKIGRSDVPLLDALRYSLYKGNLLLALDTRKIKDFQRYGVTFTSVLTKDGESVTDIYNVKLSEKMTFREILDGNGDDWVGATQHYDSAVSEEYKEWDCKKVTVTVRCLA